ncbi:MAG: permease [Agarilytica sp.]
MGDCCGPKKPKVSTCEGAPPSALEGAGPQTEAGCCNTSKRFDYLFWGPLLLVAVFYFTHLIPVVFVPVFTHFSHAIFSMMNTMAWGVVAGVIMVAILSYVPKEMVIAALGNDKGIKGIFRATLAGVLLDLCSHGILMVGAKLYERGVSNGQVMAFLIASPWNSFSLTLILIAFIGLGWTLLFILFSLIVAIISGLVFNHLTATAVLPENPHRAEVDESYSLMQALRQLLKGIPFNSVSIKNFVQTGFIESKMVIRWLLIGVLIAAAIQTFVNDEVFAQYFGASLVGLLLTMIAATIIEVCSEGASPIAADIFHRAQAPGNSFAFLMAGVSTDYTEIMVLKERTRSWKLALFLPLVTLPQIFTLAILINFFA